MRLYSTASDGGFDFNYFIVCRWRLASETVVFLLDFVAKNCPLCPSKIANT
ncbi:MAG: hypothetical protein LBP59_17900 [Planctomycetaceae bacterium]|nr:hypothetical protein [Planctomycetaceae bacterium]